MPIRFSRIFLSLIGLTIIGASGLPWAVLTTDLASPQMPSAFSAWLQQHLAVAIFLPGSQPFTAWRGDFLLGIYGIPNWVVVLAASGLPFLARYPQLVLGITVLSLLHLGLFAVAIGVAADALHLGYWLTVLAYLITLGWSVQQLWLRIWSQHTARRTNRPE